MPATTINGHLVMIDCTIPYDEPQNLEKGYSARIAKYSSHGTILPLVMGSLGSWDPCNDHIRSLFCINQNSWKTFRHITRLLAIKHSLAIIHNHTKTLEIEDDTTDDPVDTYE